MSYHLPSTSPLSRVQIANDRMQGSPVPLDVGVVVVARGCVMSMRYPRLDLRVR